MESPRGIQRPSSFIFTCLLYNMLTAIKFSAVHWFPFNTGVYVFLKKPMIFLSDCKGSSPHDQK